MVSNWDIALLIVVSAQALASSYLYEPKWKALIMSLPFPFTFASLALNQPINTVNMLAMVILFLFMQAVRVLYVRFKVPIVISILLSTIAYCLCGWLLAKLVPAREDVFLWSAAFVFLLGIILYRLLPVREEPGDRTTLPIWIKLPLTLVLVGLLIWLKGELRGAITAFPMVSVFVAYEARKSLWTMGRQNTIVLITMAPMLVIIHFCTAYTGLELALVVGWVVFLPMLIIINRLRNKKQPLLVQGGSSFDGGGG